MTYTEKTHQGFTHPIDATDPRTLAWLIRRHGLEMTHLSRGSHIGAIFSLAEIMATLYARVLRVRPQEPGLAGAGPADSQQGPRGGRQCMPPWQSVAF